MGKQEYELVMSKVDDIAAAVNKFPQSAQGVACKEIISSLIGDSSLSSNGSVSRASVSNGHKSATDSRVLVDDSAAKNLEWYAENFDLISINNLQFAAFVAYYFCEFAAEEERVDAIDKDHLETASDIVGRDLPGASTLSDAKTKSRYLVSKGRGKYVPSHAGKRYVKNELLKRDQE